MALAEVIPTDEFAATMKPVRQASHAPGHIYSSPEIYAAEKETIFLKDWLAVAGSRSCPSPAIS